jgi:hypothetical protein
MREKRVSENGGQLLRRVKKEKGKLQEPKKYINIAKQLLWKRVKLKLVPLPKVSKSHVTSVPYS